MFKELNNCLLINITSIIIILMFISFKCLRKMFTNCILLVLYYYYILYILIMYIISIHYLPGPFICLFGVFCPSASFCALFCAMVDRCLETIIPSHPFQLATFMFWQWEVGESDKVKGKRYFSFFLF